MFEVFEWQKLINIMPWWVFCGMVGGFCGYFGGGCNPILEGKSGRVVIDRNLVTDQLWSYRNLKAGWDGVGSYSARRDDIDRAIVLVNGLPEGIMNPVPMIFADGGIGLYWDDDVRYVDIEFEVGCISVYTRDRVTGVEQYRELLDCSDMSKFWWLFGFLMGGGDG